MELIRMTNKVNDYIEKYVTLVKADLKEEVLGIFDQMHQFFPYWVAMTCPVMHPDIYYVSKNCQDVFGHGHEYMLANSRPEKFFAHVHPSDRENLLDCYNYMHDYIANVAPGSHHEYRCILHYRFKKRTGQYMYLKDEKSVLNLDGSGNLYYALFLDVSGEKKFNGVKIEVFKQERSMIKIDEYKPSLGYRVLTKREGEIIALVKQGLSTKEVAWHLNISHNTVRNTKSRLFEKFQVNNTVELLNMTA